MKTPTWNVGTKPMCKGTTCTAPAKSGAKVGTFAPRQKGVTPMPVAYQGA